MYEKLLKTLSDDASAVEKYMNERMETYTDKDTLPVREAELYSLMGGGKRIRPFLIIEFCRTFSGKTEAAVPFAAAMEMMHTFSLIHDDLPCMDDDDLRRGRPTSHVMFGEATAVLAGDSLALRAIQTALENEYVSDADARRAALSLSRAAGSEGMIGGQIMDMRGEKERLSFDTLLKLHSKKTGALIRESAKLGCIAAGLGDDAPEALAADEYASDIGMAFQIVDDILDVTSDPFVLGKSVGGDADHHKTTFMTYMNTDEARKYAAELTEKAINTVWPYDHTGILTELARYLLARNK